MQIRDVMNTQVTCVSPAMTMLQAARIFNQAAMGGAPVVNEHGVLVGLITKSHFIKAIANGHTHDCTVADMMITEVFTLSETMTINELQQNDMIYRYSCFPVLDIISIA